MRENLCDTFGSYLMSNKRIKKGYYVPCTQLAKVPLWHSVHLFPLKPSLQEHLPFESHVELLDPCSLQLHA